MAATPAPNLECMLSVGIHPHHIAPLQKGTHDGPDYEPIASNKGAVGKEVPRVVFRIALGTDRVVHFIEGSTNFDARA